MAVGEDPGERLGIEEACCGGVARNDVDFRTIAPDEERASGFQQACGGMRVLLHREIPPFVWPALDQLSAERTVTRAKADEGNQQEYKENPALVKSNQLIFL